MAHSSPSRPAVAAAPGTAPTRSRLIRRDIQGLRAVAVGAVIAFHAGVPHLAGGYVGVDVFFVISGFLITGQLVRMSPDNRVRNAVNFYGRRILRLLPMSSVVLIATVVLCRVLLPPLAYPAVALSGRATALYYINIFLANRNTAYLSDIAPSPFQQYWSLAVEEQFYLFWPAALVILILISRRRRLGIAAWIALGSAASFALSVYVTARQQPTAFFWLPTRAWEFGLGALLAVAAPHLRRLTRPATGALGWAGLAMIVASILLFDGHTLFPGWAALLPALGATAVIAGGASDEQSGPGTLLALGPLVWLGDISYSLYLWHWPLLVVPALDRATPLGPLTRALLVVATVVLAAASRRWIEGPIRLSGWLRARAWRPFALAVLLTALGLAATNVGGRVPALFVNKRLPTWPATAQVDQAPTPSFVGVNMTPSLRRSPADVPVMPASCMVGFLATAAVTCVSGDRHASRTVVLFGDSHAQQWFPAVNEVAQRDGYRLVTLLKVSCPPMPVHVYNVRLGREYRECDEWRLHAVAKLAQLKPALIVIGHYLGERLDSVPKDPPKLWATALDALLHRLPSASHVLLVGDGPAWPYSPNVCLSGHITDAQKCSEAEKAGLDLRHDAMERQTAQRDGATVIDTASLLCPAGRCSTVFWNVDGYRDVNHVTATLAIKMTPVFQHAMSSALPASS